MLRRGWFDAAQHEQTGFETRGAVLVIVRRPAWLSSFGVLMRQHGRPLQTQLEITLTGLYTRRASAKAGTQLSAAA
jgi:hypothetical protein